MPKSPYRPFTPNPEQQAVTPATSGNTVNGMGETEFRQATPIYWRDPDTIAHGDLQRWFYKQDPDNPAIAAARNDRLKIFDIEVPEVEGKPAELSPQEWTKQLSDFANSIDIELFGITRLKPEWTYEGEELNYPWIIMIGVAHDYEQISLAPESEAGAEVVKQYGRGLEMVKSIAGWLRQRGWNAKFDGGPMAGPILMIPAALECGFGELGKHGSIINRDYGSSFRLAYVLTDTPLIATPKTHYGVDDFCARCQVCANACPPEAILPEKVQVRGKEKWYVDFDKCIPFFNQHFGCAICIAVCPWSKPGTGPRIVQQLIRRAEKQKLKLTGN